MKCTALWHLDTRQSALREEELAGRDKVTIRSLYSLISMGTELTVAKGQVPSQLYDMMQVPGMGGSFDLPIKYGYSLVGQRQDNDAVVHVMSPHQTWCEADDSMLMAVPANIPAPRATLASNLGTALTALWDAAVLPGERILVVGFGLVGSLVARLASAIPATEVRFIDVNHNRHEYALRMGFKSATESGISGASFDVAFNCTGVGAGLQTAIDSVGKEGRIIEMSWYGNRDVTIKLGLDFHPLRKQIIGSQVSSIPQKLASRWDFNRRKETVFRLLQNPVFDEHITHHISLREAVQLFNRWRKESPEGLAYCIDYSI